MGFHSATADRWTGAAAALAVLILLAGSAWGQEAATCQKAEFEAVVDEAAAALRDLNAKNKPEFHERLRQLKEKRGWDHDQFLKEAAPFVIDDQIEVYDTASNDLLTRISQMGQEGSTAKSPDCTMLFELRGYMQKLVEAQSAKWAYMFGKLDAELAR